MTSNLGSDLIAEHQGDYQKQEQTVVNLLKKQFRPEFLNRVDDTIIFQPLSEKQIKEIVKLEIKKLEEQVSEQDLSLEVTVAAVDHFAETGYDPVFGARPIQRLLQKEILDELSMLVIQGEVKPGDKVKIDWDGEQVLFK